ncbi:hypothetical protein A3A45_00555 [Candidatus Daviesbacteria bacterium RIFCSPLOWO2_01_FULL_36_8]|nr:MAG: hypothetical protein A3A45_00555 [Candidatus Daviesbacteria bacterium RIFCSPLOWO2_01_FULL_36_8]
MSKQKTNKSIQKRIKITSKGKILRRHQLGAGHLKRNKSKGALNSQKKTAEYFTGESKHFKDLIR